MIDSRETIVPFCFDADSFKDSCDGGIANIAGWESGQWEECVLHINKLYENNKGGDEDPPQMTSNDYRSKINDEIQGVDDPDKWKKMCSE